MNDFEKLYKQIEDNKLANIHDEREINIILHALKKQIPMEAQKITKWEDYYICPACNYEFPDIGGMCEIYGVSETPSFCECGQRLKYSNKFVYNEFGEAIERIINVN